jgi:hypothetical protein
MYQPDDDLQLPHRRTRIWRYIDFPTLLCMLQRRELFFRSIGRMRDPYDGDIREDVYGRYWEWEMGLPPDEPAPGVIGGRHVRQAVREFTCINCWHMNSAESAAMWALYSPNYGIAIRSTIGRLIRSFRTSPTAIAIGAVQYINFDSPRRREASLIASPLYVKRTSFEHERELRAAILEPSVFKEKLPGKGVETDVAVLIEKIFTSPLVAGSWLTDVVREELRLHGLHGVEVIHSPLYSRDLG